jgi:hypothetical protein
MSMSSPSLNTLSIQYISTLYILGMLLTSTLGSLSAWNKGQICQHNDHIILDADAAIRARHPQAARSGLTIVSGNASQCAWQDEVIKLGLCQIVYKV